MSAGAASADGSSAPWWVQRLVDGAPDAARCLAALGGAARPVGPPGRREGRRAAVLVCLSPGSTAAPAAADPVAGGADALPGDVLLLERAAGLRAHAGQPALPGGAVDAGDADEVAAALREAREETGLATAGVQVLGRMPVLRVPPEGFAVTPVLAWEPVPSPVAPGAAEEVARVLRAPLAELVDPARRVVVTWERPAAPGRGRLRGEGPGFEVGGLLVWGFTAALLAALLDAAGLSRPWDGARRVAAPPPPPSRPRSEVPA
ncbi:CoA pyrophosphatase [uncultured Pseudokineococcus sp.]|uniref:NUDIX hydrolase n=1 Tax=uncultured Pseudokineococcus sp. TaxID=1642928 RepID=UPI002625FF44|nr:CoA pyrophosphatase [uncultured Pseudokineococcus sp.]